MAPNSLEEHLRLLQSFCRYNANHNHHKHSAFVTYPDIVSVSHPRGVAPCPCLPFLLPSSMSHSQSQRLLAFGVDARILNLRLITIFTSYSLARSLALCLPSVRPSVVQRKLQLLPQLLLEEEKMLLLLLHQLPRPDARPPSPGPAPTWYVAFGGGAAAAAASSSPSSPLRSIFLSPREVNATCRAASVSEITSQFSNEIGNWQYPTSDH